MDNLLIIMAILIGIGLIGTGVYFFLKNEKEKQIEIIKEWLLLAVVQAEKALGNGTGQIKLRYVYDLFLVRFKYLSRFITFEQFSVLVDMALIKMRTLLESNVNLKNYVGDTVNIK